mgnify:CR=1 FL=1|jgi:GT2 family glycosyltransferase
MKISVILSIYNAESYIEGYFQNALNQVGIQNVEFSIIHNNPSSIERKIVQKYSEKLNIVYKEVNLESLYESWNRAILQSSGKYLACWNIDDLRDNDSLERMARTLDKNKDVGFTYGDFVIVNKFNKTVGKNISTPEFTKHLGTTGAIGGPFFMWRRNLLKDIGYFDEQFKSGGDFDYTVRLSIFSTGKKTKGIIGYFLNTSNGISTKNKPLQVIERTAIELRYAIWYKIDVNYIGRALNYSINTITSNDSNRGIDNAIVSLTNNRKIWVLLIFYGYIKSGAISIVKKLIRR